MEFGTGGRMEVKSYSAEGDYFLCIDSSGEVRRLDLLTSGCFENITPKELVGKFVTVGYTHPFLEMAEGVSIETIRG